MSGSAFFAARWCSGTMRGMQHPGERISYLRRTNSRNTRVPFGIKQADRLSHMYFIGKTGVGKSTLLGRLRDRILRLVVGLHWWTRMATCRPLAERMQKQAPDRVVYLNASDPKQPYGYNPLRRVREDKIPLAVSGTLETLKKIWPDAWGVRMEHVLRNSLYALLERDGSTLPDILALLRMTIFGRRSSKAFAIRS